MMTRILFLLAATAAWPTGNAIAKEGAIQCANLIYGGSHTSRCFSDEFLSAVQRETTIPTERRFKAVKLGSDELFKYPFVMMTGEQKFNFTPAERENLKRYLTNGGFLLASAGCSSKLFNDAFKAEIRTLFPDKSLVEIPMSHPIFRTVHQIDQLKLSKGASAEPARLLGLEHNGKIVAVYSPHGLNDTAHTEGCCCCGGNEIQNAINVNINIFVYALLQ
jgi:hypothetical protein